MTSIGHIGFGDRDVPEKIAMKPAAGHTTAAQTAAQAPVLDFASVYHEHLDFLWRSAGSLGIHRDHIADVMQDVFVVVHRRLSTFAGDAQLRTWLYGILLNVVRDYRRARRRKPTSALEETEELAAGGALDQQAEVRERMRTFEAALQLLSDDERTLFVMLYVEEFSPKEAAQLLGLSLEAVYSRARRVKEAFERALAKTQLRKTARAAERRQTWVLGGAR